MYFFHPAVVLIIVLCIPRREATLIQVPTTRPSFTTENPTYVRLPSINEILPDGKDHPCYRDCNGPPKTCYYHFTVEWYQSMSKACFDCPFNVTDCGRNDCVAVNGVSRTLTTINRKLPGPSIEASVLSLSRLVVSDDVIVDGEHAWLRILLCAAGMPHLRRQIFRRMVVCLNDTIIVDVENDLMSSGTTIHWHGMYQKDTPYMDGVPFVTQCPIQPESFFRYEYKAVQPGTYFWHSHIGLQRADGATGALIIRQAKTRDPHGPLYDYDLSEHTLLVTDWINRLSLVMFTERFHSSGEARPTSLLINGAGRFQVTAGNRTAKLPAPRFEVTKGRRYRFRLINAEFLNCPVEMSVDGHNITVIASDGSDLEPVTAASLVTYAGERFDFIVHANNKVDNYWIRVRGLMECAREFNGARQVGVLHYKGPREGEPLGNLTWDALHNDGLQVNAVNQGEEQHVTKTISKLRSLQGSDASLKPVPDYKFFVSYDLYAKNNSHFNTLPNYGYNQVKRVFANRTPQLNHISMKLPTSPLLVSRPSVYSFCNESTVSNFCKEGYCQCPHVLTVKLNSVVEVIIIDEGEPLDTNHPFHLHGYHFRVIGQRRLDSKTSAEKVKSLDKAGLLSRNLNNPPFKDTVTIPDGGYTIIRFYADNPGYWLFHCHIEFHAEVGMALVFKVGEHSDMKPIPNNFPTCGHFNNRPFEPNGPEIVKDIKNVENKM